jgi:hypothetical protein
MENEGWFQVHIHTHKFSNIYTKVILSFYVDLRTDFSWDILTLLV